MNGVSYGLMELCGAYMLLAHSEASPWQLSLHQVLTAVWYSTVFSSPADRATYGW